MGWSDWDNDSPTTLFSSDSSATLDSIHWCHDNSGYIQYLEMFFSDFMDQKFGTITNLNCNFIDVQDKQFNQICKENDTANAPLKNAIRLRDHNG